MPGAPFELRRGRLNWAGGGSETGAKPWLWNTSGREGIRSSSATTGRATVRSISSCVTRRPWSSFQSTKQTTKAHELRFRVLLTDAVREVCFERVAAG